VRLSPTGVHTILRKNDIGDWLHNELEGYEIPRELVGRKNSFGELIPEHLYPIFRDE
jgi:MTH538 TIR-like domain (DUF1863)